MQVIKINRDQSCVWFEKNAASETTSHKIFSRLVDCPIPQNDEPLTLIIPGEDIAMHVVRLPAMRASEIRRAIPFALEEQLACDPENIDVAIDTQKKDGSI